MIAGIDVGLTGGVALLNDDGTLAAAMMLPTRSFPGGSTHTVKKKIDALALFAYLGALQPSFVFIEDPGIVTRGSLAGASLHNSFGTVLSVVEICEIPCRLVRANGQKGWKQVYGLDGLKGINDSQKKARSREAARAFFPELEKLKVKEHGVAEAALIARYGIKYLLPGER